VLPKKQEQRPALGLNRAPLNLTSSHRPFLLTSINSNNPKSNFHLWKTMRSVIMRTHVATGLGDMITPQLG
jgi:hypothetical protein